MHLKEAVLSGEEKLRLFHLNHWYESKLFSDREKSALCWLEALTETGKSSANDEAFDNLKQYFDDEEIVDMTYVISMINFWNRLGLAFKPDPGSLDEMYGLNKVAL
jgi:alkylhydroperoxidase family enzyme